MFGRSGRRRGDLVPMMLEIAAALLLVCPGAARTAWAADVTIAGVVTDADGKPIVGAVVGNPMGRKALETTTDAEGRFKLSDPQVSRDGGGYPLIVRAPGFASLSQRVQGTAEEVLGKVVIRMARGHSIRGRVVTQAGEAIKNAFVSAHDGSAGDPGARTFADDEGRFTFDTLRERSRFLVQVAGYPFITNLLLKLDGEDEVVVVLERGVDVRGRVVDAETGKPVESFRIRVSLSRPMRGDITRSNLSNALVSGVPFRSAEGAFVISEITKGLALEIFVEADGYERVNFPRIVAGNDDDAKTLARVPLKKRDGKPATFAGKLADEHGKALAGVQLRLIVTAAPFKGGPNGFSWSMIEHDDLARVNYVDQYLRAVSDAEGKFEFKDLLAGKFLELAYWGNGTPRGRWSAPEKTVAGEGKSAIIKVAEPAVVRGSFDPADFPKARGISFALDNWLLNIFLQLKEGETEFRIGELPSGSVRVSLTGPNMPVTDRPDTPGLFRSETLATRTLTIEAGKTYDVKFGKQDVPPARGR